MKVSTPSVVRDSTPYVAALPENDQEMGSGDARGSTDPDPELERAVLGRVGERTEIEQREEETEAAEARARKQPSQPSDAEQSKHALTHTPHRDWCDHCTKGRSRQDRHVRISEEHKL
eukprot:1453803-Amphidinium_carterae.1